MTVIFQRRPAVVHEQFGDETVIVDLDSGNYYSLQGSGGEIWTLAMQGLPRSAILQRMAQQFHGDATRIADETAAFLDQLVADGLVDAFKADALAGATAGTSTAASAEFQTPSLQRYSDMEDILRLDPIHEVDETGWPSMKKAEH